MFLSTFEKQLDGKRRIVVPSDFRAAAGPLTRIFCFPSFEADCIEGGGKPLFDRYQAMIEETELGDPLRLALETTIYGQMNELGFDPAGRVVLPELLCEEAGIKDWVSVVGLGDRFQIWDRDAFRAHRAGQRTVARDGIAALRAQQRAAKLGGGQ